jgi:hypothetical protein
MSSYVNELREYVEYLDHQEKMDMEKIHQHAEMLHKRIEIKRSDYVSVVQNRTDIEKKEVEQKLSVMKQVSNTLSPATAQFIDGLKRHGKPAEIIYLHEAIADRLSQLLYIDTKPLLKKLGHYFIPGKVTESDVELLFGRIETELKSSFDMDD